MTRLILLLGLQVLLLTASGQTAAYNKTLADSLGADEYGMKMYSLVILKTGTFKPGKEASDSLMRGHMANIGRLAASGKLTVAGPFGANANHYRGIFILNVADTAKAKELLLTDPAIAAKVFDVEIYPWYGSAALPMYLPYHSQVEKTAH